MAIYYADNTRATADLRASVDLGYGTGAEINAFSSWTQAVGDKLYIKRGTTWATALDITVSNPASEAQRVLVGAYGAGARPIIDVAGATAYCVRVQNKNYITVQDLDLRNASNTCLQALGNSTRSCSELKVYRVRASGAASNGISLTQAVNTSGYVPDGAPATGVVMEDCEAYDCGQHGVAVVAYALAPVLRRCKAARCSPSSSGWGVYLGGFFSQFNSDASWSNVSGAIYKRTITGFTGAGTPAKTVYAVVSGQSESAYFLAEAGSSAVSDGQWYFDTATKELYINVGNDPRTGTSISVVYQPCTDGLIEDSEAWDMDAAYDGVGIGLDRGTYRCRVVGCYAHENPGPGIEIAQAYDAIVSGNRSENNTGVGLHAATTGGVIRMCNNYARGNTGGGLSLERQNSGASMIAKNNILVGGGIGIYAATLGGTNDIDNNLVYGATTAYSGLSAGAADRSDDPAGKIHGDGRVRVPYYSGGVLATNPLATAGAYVAGVRLERGRRLSPGTYKPLGPGSVGRI